jgi:hypothetical protein
VRLLIAALGARRRRTPAAFLAAVARSNRRGSR